MATAILNIGLVDSKVKPVLKDACDMYCKLIMLIGSFYGRRIGDAFKLGKDSLPSQMLGALSRKGAKATLLKEIDSWMNTWQGRYGENAPVEKRVKQESIDAKKSLVKATIESINGGALTELLATVKCLSAHYATCGTFGDNMPITLRQVCGLIVAPALTPRQMKAKFELTIGDENA